MSGSRPKQPGERLPRRPPIPLFLLVKIRATRGEKTWLLLELPQPLGEGKASGGMCPPQQQAVGIFPPFLSYSSLRPPSPPALLSQLCTN